MYAQTLVVSALALVASAQIHPVARRDFIVARQSGIADPACQSALQDLLPLYSSLPTPPPAIVTASVSLPSDPCATPSLPASLASVYSSYASTVGVWFSSNSASIFGALSKCPALTQYATGVPVCTAAVGGGAGGAGGAGSTTAAAPTGTGSIGGGSGGANGTVTTGRPTAVSSSATPVRSNGASRETGLIAAGIAAAGFVAAVAAL